MYIQRTPNCKLLVEVCGLQRKPLILRSLFTSSWTCTCLVQNLFSDSCKVIQKTAWNTSAFAAWVDRECMDRSSKFPVTSFSDCLCCSSPNFRWQIHLLITNQRTSFMCQRKKCHANFWYNCFLSCSESFFFFVFRKSFPSKVTLAWGLPEGGVEGDKMGRKGWLLSF